MTPPANPIPESTLNNPVLRSVVEHVPASSANVLQMLGVPFHILTQAESLLRIEKLISERIPKQVCLANAYTVALAQHDTELRQLLQKSALVLADGMSIVWGGRWVGASLPERIPGPDLMEALCRRASRRAYKIFLMGTSITTLYQLHEKLLRLCPGLQIVGTYSPTMCDRLSENENQQILNLLKATKPDILFVGMSCPKQEKWIADNLSRLPVPVSLGVGAAFDFLSGNIPRAPHWMRDVGLEWFYRLSREPRRLWKRYLLGNMVFLSLLALEAIRTRLFNPHAGANLPKAS